MRKGQLPFPAASEHCKREFLKRLLLFLILQSEFNQETSMCMHTHNVVFICKVLYRSLSYRRKGMGHIASCQLGTVKSGLTKILVNKEMNIVDIQKNTQDVCIMLTNNYKSVC